MAKPAPPPKKGSVLKTAKGAPKARKTAATHKPKAAVAAQAAAVAKTRAKTKSKTGLTSDSDTGPSTSGNDGALDAIMNALPPPPPPPVLVVTSSNENRKRLAAEKKAELAAQTVLRAENRRLNNPAGERQLVILPAVRGSTRVRKPTQLGLGADRADVQLPVKLTRAQIQAKKNEVSENALLARSAAGKEGTADTVAKGKKRAAVEAQASGASKK